MTRNALTKKENGVREKKSTLLIDEACFESRGVVVESVLPGIQVCNSIQPESSEAALPKYDVISLQQHPDIKKTQLRDELLRNNNQVSIFKDEDVNGQVVQIQGQREGLVFSVTSVLRYLVLFIKNLKQFVEIDVTILVSGREYKVMKVTNARSLAKVDADRCKCQIPLLFGAETGWRYLCMDLKDLSIQAFGTEHIATTRIRIRGFCRLLRVYFQEEEYHDHQLPPYLSLLGTHDDEDHSIRA
uniref:Uncharacterized protein AlNc14C17G1810 n=1 Tax=Albugo laibachii Nc14 TaxID=890382 RepID=F0W4I9_9STRA|nr:conserved hypothetical protein [Albugo laibachii Nc14]|eukprot:CCA16022.1 conserved hypothetical protein [Albugo laibachii Nc14]